MSKPYWSSDLATLYHGDCIKVMHGMERSSVDVVFADPPYFLSTENGTTNRGGKRVSVDKGDWDAKRDFATVHRFNGVWLSCVRRVLKPSGTLWACGTQHNVHSLAMAMLQFDMKILNEIVWEKSNPPPHLACRYFTHSHENLIWARRSEAIGHYFNYAAMKSENGGKQMKDVWKGTPPGPSERVGHPTQKPLWLVRRCLKASAKPGAVILDPFNGSGTTGVAALESPHRGWSYIGIDSDESCLEMTRRRF